MCNFVVGDISECQDGGNSTSGAAVERWVEVEVTWKHREQTGLWGLPIHVLFSVFSLIDDTMNGSEVTLAPSTRVYMLAAAIESDHR